MFRFRQERAAAIAAPLVLGILAAAPPAQAQQTEIEAVRAQLAELQSRLDKLEATQKAAADTAAATAAKAGPPVVSASKLPVTVAGLLQVNGRVFSSQSGPGASSFNTLQLRRGDIRLTGNVTPRISGMILIDPAKATSATSTSTVVPARPGSPAGTPPTVTTVTNINQAGNVLQEMQLSYLLNKTAHSSNTIDVGEYKIPIGYEGDLVSAAGLQTVDRALFFLARDPFNGGNGDIRETGIRLRGSTGPFDYQLGVFNGFGERQNALSASNAKPVIGRLIYNVPHLKGLMLGVSGGTGTTRNTPLAGQRARRELGNAFAVYKRDAWTVQAEYLAGNNVFIRNAPITQHNIQGYYGSVGYLFRPRIEGVLRYDSFDFDKDLVARAGTSSDTTVSEATIGLNYYIKGNNAKIQANLVHRNGGAGLVAANGFGGNATGFSKSRTELRTNFQVGF